NEGNVAWRADRCSDERRCVLVWLWWSPCQRETHAGRAVVFGWNDARVGALLIDRNGRQTGWKRDRSIREIAGCMLQSGSEEGIPDEAPPDTFVQTTPADTVQRQILRTPM